MTLMPKKVLIGHCPNGMTSYETNACRYTKSAVFDNFLGSTLQLKIKTTTTGKTKQMLFFCLVFFPTTDVIDTVYGYHYVPHL